MPSDIPFSPRSYLTGYSIVLLFTPLFFVFLYFIGRLYDYLVVKCLDKEKHVSKIDNSLEKLEDMPSDLIRIIFELSLDISLTASVEIMMR